MSVRLEPTPEESRRLARVARGAEPADLVLSGGGVVNVFTEEILDGWGVAVAGDRIAYVGPDVGALAGDRTETIDVDGALIAPGLIDGHTHLIRAWLDETVAGHLAVGVTGLVIDGVEVAIAFGRDGLRDFAAEAARSPGRVFLAVPAETGLDPVHDERIGGPDAFVDLLDADHVIGVGEVFWSHLLRHHPRAEAMIEAAMARGLRVEGHGAGAKPAGLNAIAGYGIVADHESINAADARNRARLGLYTLLRHGATRADLAEYAELWAEGAEPMDFSRMGLVTDGVDPGDLADGRALNWVVAEAVASGLPLARAIRMATLVPAERHGIGRWLGGVGPGMLADLIVIRGTEGLLRPEHVLVGGRPPGTVPAPALAPAAPLRLDGLDPALVEHPGPGRWRAMQLVGPLVTREIETGGEAAQVIVAIDKSDARRGFRGLLVDFGLQRGAVAWTSGWESAAVLATGASAADMRAAIERLASSGGGIAVVEDGEVRAEWRAELGGALTRAPLAALAADIERANRALIDLGVAWEDPLLTLESLTGAAIPFLRISPAGYYRIRDGVRPGLEWDDDGSER
jgi:adenine deaminase